MKKILLVSLLTSAISTPALAMEYPQHSSYDSRIQYVNYNPGNVVMINAMIGAGSQIVFGKDEKIQEAASGFTSGWELVNKRNILYLKPKSIKAEGGNAEDSLMLPTPAKWNTNLLVTTNKHYYAFDLRLLTKNTSTVAYRVEFDYPEERNKANNLQQRLAQKPVPVNWQYSMKIGKHSDSIAPVMAYDDGRFTYLRFPANRDFPAAFLLSDDNKESIVNSNVGSSIVGGNNDTLIIHKVSKRFVLRLGQEVVGIYNDHFDPYGIAPVNGTTVNGLTRVIKEQVNE